MKVQISETRTLVGTFMAYDKHMNLVLGDCEEYRRIRGKKEGTDREEKRLLGLVLLRGENVISLSADSPPPPAARGAIAAGATGHGVGKSAGRGMPVAPLSKAPRGLSGPVRGVGGPAHSTMQPQMKAAQPVSYARGQAMNRPPPPPNARPPPPPGGAGGPPGGFGRPPFQGGPPGGFGRGGPPPPGGFMGRGGPPGGFQR